jgi:hypothetical protein
MHREKSENVIEKRESPENDIYFVFGRSPALCAGSGYPLQFAKPRKGVLRIPLLSLAQPTACTACGLCHRHNPQRQAALRLVLLSLALVPHSPRLIDPVILFFCMLNNSHGITKFGICLHYPFFKIGFCLPTY